MTDEYLTLEQIYAIYDDLAEYTRKVISVLDPANPATDEWDARLTALQEFVLEAERFIFGEFKTLFTEGRRDAATKQQKTRTVSIEDQLDFLGQLFPHEAKYPADF